MCDCTEGPCGPGNEACGPLFGRDSPQYHPRDLSCSMNDPNFPFFFSGMYHLMWQKHCAELHTMGDGRGPIIGHAVSRDMVRWKALPVTLWNNAPYDSVAIFTGSASLVEGVPTLVYPGICDPATWEACGGHFINLAIATPANLSDPYLMKWDKAPYNPIVNVSQRDPSTSWRTAGGEWRMTNYDGVVYSSWDFIEWKTVGSLFPSGECPDFFPLPPACSWEGCVQPEGGLPTHVHKLSRGGQDWYFLGNYSEGGENTTGAWVPSPTAPSKGQALDGSAIAAEGGRPHTGPLYASKTFWDTSGEGRRISWGWVSGGEGSSAQTARLVTYHAGLQMLLFSPLPELATLRTQPPLFSSPTTLTLTPGEPGVWLSQGWPAGAGNTSDFTLVFLLPQNPSRFGLTVNAEAAGMEGGFGIALSWDPRTRTLNATTGGGGGGAIPVPILQGETEIDIELLFDSNFFEVFVGKGRRAITQGIPQKNSSSTAGAYLWASGSSVLVSNVTVWGMASCWVE